MLWCGCGGQVPDTHVTALPSCVCALQARLISLIMDACQGDVETEDSNVVQYALGLWLGCAIDRRALLEEFLVEHTAKAEEFALAGLFCQGSEQASACAVAAAAATAATVRSHKLTRRMQVRKEFTHALHQICLNVEDITPKPRDFFLQLLLRSLPTPGDDARCVGAPAACTWVHALISRGFCVCSAECGQFFDLLCTLVKDSAMEAGTLERVLKDLVERLLFHPYVEERNSDKVDKVRSRVLAFGARLAWASPHYAPVPRRALQLLVGVLQLLTALIETNPSHFQLVAEEHASRLLANSDGGAKRARSTGSVPGGGAAAPDITSVPAALAPRGLVTELFYNCLFARPPVGSSVTDKAVPSPPRCKTDASRKAAFGLLTSLTHNCPRNLDTLFQYGLVPLEKQFTKVRGAGCDCVVPHGVRARGWGVVVPRVVRASCDLACLCLCSVPG